MRSHTKWEQKRPNELFKWETKESHLQYIYIENYRWIITQHSHNQLQNSTRKNTEERRKKYTYTQIDYRRQNNV